MSGNNRLFLELNAATMSDATVPYGLIKAGQRADLTAVWDIKHPAEVAYRVDFNPLHSRISGGNS
jgi:imidazolonepropionase-like amidohydrolase